MADENTDTPQEQGFDLDGFFKSRTVGNLRRGPGAAEESPPSPALPREGGGSETTDPSAGDSLPDGGDSPSPLAGEGRDGGKKPAPEGDDSQQETPDEKQRRFRSWDEAEEGYRNAQSDLTRRQQEAAKARKEAEAARKEADRVRKEAEEYRARVDAFEREKAEAKMYQELDAFASDRFKEAQKEVRRLDMDAEDYDEKSAGIMAQAETEVRRKARELEKSLDLPKAETPAASTAPERDTPAGAAPTDGETGTEGQRDKGTEKAGEEETSSTPAVDPDEAQRIFDERMSAEGLDPEDPLFLGFVQKVPHADEHGNALDFEGRLNWAVEQTKRHRGREAAKAKQTANAPLPRGGQGRPAPKGEKPPEPMSLGDAIEAAREKRRIRPAAR